MDLKNAAFDAHLQMHADHVGVVTAKIKLNV